MKSNKRLNFFYKKRSFILIEVIVAFMLITLLIVPLIRNPIYFFTSQMISLEKLECERIADLTFLDLKILLYQNQLNTNNLPTALKNTPFKQLDDYKFKSFNKKDILRSYKLYSRRKEKETPLNEHYKLLNIRIYLRSADQTKPYKYDYKMTVCKLNHDFY